MSTVQDAKAKLQSSDRCSRRNPCRVCGKDHWCCNVETMTICTEEASQYWNEGLQAWLHPLPGESWDENAPRDIVRKERPKRPEPQQKAGLARRHQVYTALLERLPLNGEHIDHLGGERRKLSTEQINARGYATIYGDGDAEAQEEEAFRIAADIELDHGDIANVPGFGHRESWSNKPGTAIAGAICLAPRIAIPIRSIEGMIEGFQLLDPSPECAKKRRYSWFSGVGDDGAGIGKPLHVSRPTIGTSKSDVIITEGPLKADIVSDHTGITTVAFQGVKAIDWDSLATVIDTLAPTRILLAVDADRKTNKDVREAHEALCRWCSERDQAYLVADWEIEDGKGLDDLLLGGGKPAWLEPAPLEPLPEAKERDEIERYALTSSWSQPGTARELTQFPNAAWESKLHRGCVDAVRRLLSAGEDLNVRSIRRMLKIHASHLLPQFKDLEEWYQANQTGLASLQKTAVAEFREEYDWGSMNQWLTSARERFRLGEYDSFYENLYRGLCSLAPGSSEEYEIESLETIMLRRIEQHTSQEGLPEIVIPTGIKALDQILGGGFHQGSKVLLMGKPGSGKTTAAKQFAVNASMLDHTSLFMSLEMRKRSLGDRAIAMATQKPLRDKYSEKDWEAARRHAHLFRNVSIDDRPAKLDEFTSRVDNFLYKHPKTAMVFTDYAGRIKDRKRGQTDQTAAADVADAWADTADRHDVCHVLLQQPTKEYDRSGIPSTEYIRDSGVFQQHADVILWFHKNCQFRDQIQDPDFAEIHVLKHRAGAANHVVPVKVRAACFTVQDWHGAIPGDSSGDTARASVNKALSDLV